MRSIYNEIGVFPRSLGIEQFWRKQSAGRLTFLKRIINLAGKKEAKAEAARRMTVITLFENAIEIFWESVIMTKQ